MSSRPVLTQPNLFVIVSLFQQRSRGNLSTDVHDTKAFFPSFQLLLRFGGDQLSGMLDQQEVISLLSQVKDTMYLMSYSHLPFWI